MDEYAHVVNVDGVVARARDEESDDSGDSTTEYLLIERSAEEDHAAGLLGLPGGKLEPGPGTDHAVEATVRREIEEEVGLTVGGVEYVCSGTFETDTGYQCLNVVTLCEHVGGDARPREPDEVAAVHWLTLDDLRAREDVPEFTETYVERAAAVAASE
ncbi:NUDIX domain-containing protein [Halosimplex litoreum]|uniref:NUDIX domain-containing protein n=1 Tax=Halosimplex litoreum TaxID=1198301 RepID=A0A7T3FWV9_9EURY|nr:NUDIX domain-containing protein [Halosimplex litoreum]QPV62132.1 NUDIX domain-containing protein [Halosimplex litoreum]